MPGIHHPKAPTDPAMLTPHPRESCDADRCGMRPWRAEDQTLYQDGWRAGYAAGYLAAIQTLRTGAEAALRIAAPLPGGHDVLNLSRDEARTLRVWMDEHGYTAQRGEPLADWQARTAPVAYQYALLIEAGCEHRRSDAEPYCALCGALMEGMTR